MSSALALAVVFTLLLSTNVRAHARLESSSFSPGAILPSVPSTVIFSFTEPIDPGYSTASLIDSAGTPVSQIDLTIDPADSAMVTMTILTPAQPAGSYAIVWRVLSATDGHATTGSLAFSAGTGVSPDLASTTSAVNAPWVTIAARWLELASLLAVTGALAFAVCCPEIVRAQPSFSRAMRQILAIAGIGGLGGTIVSSMALAISATNRSWGDLPSIQDWWETLRGTDLGNAIIVRTGLSIAELVAAALLRRRASRSIFALAAIVEIAGLASFSLTGHARAAGQGAIAVAVDIAHLTSAAAWGGGIALLSLFLFRQLSVADDTAAAIAISRFSTVALGAMAVLVTSGIVSAAFHVSGPKNLTGEPYGRTLIVKVLLVALVLVVAGTNRLFLVPRLRSAAVARPELARTNLLGIRRAALVEVAAALLILFAAARLTELPPADGPLTVDVAGRQGPIALSANTADLAIAVNGQLDPAAGETMTISISASATAQPAGNLARVIVLATAPDPLDPTGEPLRDRFDATAVDGSPGTYTFPRARLGIQAEWQLEVTARRLGLEDANVTFPLDLRGVGAQPPRLVSDHWKWPSLPWSGWLALLASAATFTGGIALIKRLKGLEPVTGGIFLAVVLLITGAFALSAYRSGPIPTSGSSLRNPLSASDPKLIQNASLAFAAQCATCHGVTGQGTDTPNPEHGHTGGDRDLTSSQSRQLTDGDLYTIIGDGLGGTEMPAFDVALTEEQRWELVLLIREYQRQAAESLGT